MSKTKGWVLVGFALFVLLTLIRLSLTELFSSAHYKSILVSAPPPVQAPSESPTYGKAQDDDELLAASIAKLKKGRLAYSTPEKMKTTQTERITARIGGDSVSIDALKIDLPAGKNREVDVANTPISSRMKMTLKGADFDITPLSSEEQIVFGDNPTTWAWDIVPKHSGKLKLHLAAIVELKQLSKDFVAIDREVSVQVDPLDQVSKFTKTNWQWIIATLTALFGTAWKLIKDRQKTASPHSAEPFSV